MLAEFAIIWAILSVLCTCTTPRFVLSFSFSQGKIDLSFCPSIDNEALSLLGSSTRTHTLLLEGCSRITDVTPLRAMHTLNLSGCENLLDVSSLGAVFHLTLRNSNVSDVSALGAVSVLDLSSCHRLRDVSALGAVHTLNLSWCRSITNVDMLGSVRHLNLAHCTNISVFSPLSCCKSIR
eukprot:m.397771 g.397771  ORF g.397771 m.397771 type:complete len:180 (+) comp21130_c0_seq24:1495-2034(+)